MTSDDHSTRRRPSPGHGRGVVGGRDNPDLGLEVRLGFPFWLKPFVLEGVGAITFGHRIYLHPSVSELTPDRVAAILHHEITHVNQYRRHGVVGFLGRYVFEYLRNRWRGLRAERAYLEISFEREAFAEERRIERVEDDA